MFDQSSLLNYFISVKFHYNHFYKFVRFVIDQNASEKSETEEKRSEEEESKFCRGQRNEQTISNKSVGKMCLNVNIFDFDFHQTSSKFSSKIIKIIIMLGKV